MGLALDDAVGITGLGGGAPLPLTVIQLGSPIAGPCALIQRLLDMPIVDGPAVI